MLRNLLVVQAFLLALLFCTQNAFADLAINFTNGDAPRQVLAGETTGVVPFNGWTNLNVLTSSSPLLNVGGTSIDVSWQAPVLQASTTARGAGGDGTNAIQSLFEYGLRDNSAPVGSPNAEFTISDLTSHLASQSALSYDLYVYYKSFVPGVVANDDITIGLNNDPVSTFDPAVALTPLSQPFVLAGNADSNYVVFSGLTTDSTTVSLSRAPTDGRDGLIVGFQVDVTSVPEPSSAILVSSLMALGGLRRRRKL